MFRNKRISRLIPFVWVLLLAQILPASSGMPAPASAQDQGTQVAQWVAPRGGRPFFVVGANYEGPTDRAWKLWED
ncbi:MAG TPA: hypothetical protein VM409_06915, partial [Chloroflexia bacterium]|nr:hypothetical protein [Chloroflexia bacterium]